MQRSPTGFQFPQIQAFSRTARPVGQKIPVDASRNSRRTAGCIRAQGQEKEEIYYATFPLVGLESLEGAIVFSGREIPDILAQHCAIIVERPTEQVIVSTNLLRAACPPPARNQQGATECFLLFHCT